MRLWHYELLPYLSDKALTTQWGELNTLLCSKVDNLMINYIYSYDKRELLKYAGLVIAEMRKRNIVIYNCVNVLQYFADNYEEEFEEYGDIDDIITDIIIEAQDWINAGNVLFKDHHTPSYMLQCFFNLQEKASRGAFDLTQDIMEKLTIFVTSKFENVSLYDVIMFY